MNAECEGCGSDTDTATCSSCESVICLACATLWGEEAGAPTPTCDCGEEWPS